MKKKTIIRLIIIVGVLISAFYISRIYIKAKIEEMTFELFDEDQESIKLAKDSGIQRVSFDSNGNTLYANWSVKDESYPSIFIVHGNGETLSDYVLTQLFLAESGYNTFVFDFSGFGSSEGVPTVEKLDEDAKNAWSKFCELSSKSSQQIAFGHSLGCAILLSSVNTYSTVPDDIIIHAPFSSAKEIAVHIGNADESWAWILPDVWNNLENIQTIPTNNICVVHSVLDQVTPYKMSAEIAAQNKNSKLLLIDGYQHNSLYEPKKRKFWSEVLDYKRN
ncbi:MAG: alpha/beta hydrolase [Crocinitomicaceae bacterium]|nr:alpha/beta hydrolase [Crocinitomicaceae bacterium]